MFQSLRPDIFMPSIYRLDVAALRARGIRGLILDIDNTLVPWNEAGAPETLIQWLALLDSSGLKACLLSNNTRERVTAFASVTGIPSIDAGRKPARRAYEAALEVLGTAPHETAALGDQLYPDVVGAKRMGILTILVVPLSEREFLGTRLKRIIERPLLRLMERRGWLSPQ
jgi:HAD superfamily phosphatase (TIGR01668 family)